MALTERQEEQVTVKANGVLEVRITTVIERDGVEVTRTHHRHCVEPGADCSAECEMVKKLASAIHTPEVVAARKAEIAKLEDKVKEKLNG